MMKKILPALLLLSLLVPLASDAAWWKPSDWSKRPNLISTSTATTSSVQSTVKVMEKIVQDPELLAQLKALIAENVALKAQITSLLSAQTINTVTSAAPVPVSSKTSLSEGCLALKREFDSAFSLSQVSDEEWKKDIERFKATVVDGRINNLGQKEIARIEKDGKIEAYSLLAKAKAIGKKFTSLCPTETLDSATFLSMTDILPAEPYPTTIISTDAQIKALKQKILDIKVEYNKQVKALPSGGTKSSSAATGALTQLTKKMNQDITDINLQIEQLELNRP